MTALKDPSAGHPNSITEALKRNGPALFLSLAFFLIAYWTFREFLAHGQPVDWPFHVEFALDPDEQVPPNFMLHSYFRLAGGGIAQQALIAAAAKTAAVIILARYYFKGLGLGSICYLVAILLMTAMPIAWLASDPRTYLGKFSPNVAHNPTYVLMAPFALLLWFYFSRGLAKSQDLSGKWLAGLAGLSVATAWAKPSFHLALIPTTALICGHLLIRKRRSFVLLACVGFAISLPVLLQMAAMSGLGPVKWDKSEFIVVPFEALAIHVKDPVGAIASSLLFPVFVCCLFSDKRHQYRFMLQAWLLLLSAFVVAILFAEAGHRIGHANFYWGIYAAVLILFAESSVLILSAVQKRTNRVAAMSALCVLTIHSAFGAVYHYRIANGMDPLEFSKAPTSIIIPFRN